MPGVPSGRGCEACRKQKKKVRILEMSVIRPDADAEVVRSAKAILCEMLSLERYMHWRRRAAIQIQESIGSCAGKAFAKAPGWVSSL